MVGSFSFFLVPMGLLDDLRLPILGSFARRVVVVERAVRRNLRARCGFFERCALVWGGGGELCGRLGADGGLIV